MPDGLCGYILMDKLKNLLNRNSKIRSISGNNPLLLDGGGAWLVLAGELDLFSVPMVDGKWSATGTHSVPGDKPDPFAGAR